MSHSKIVYYKPHESHFFIPAKGQKLLSIQTTRRKKAFLPPPLPYCAAIEKVFQGFFEDQRIRSAQILRRFPNLRKYK
jgi:hypothetical protein